MAQGPPQLFDRALRRIRLARAALAYADFLKARAAEDAVWRIGSILRRFPRAVDLSASGGAFARALRSSPATTQVDLLVEAELTHRTLATGASRAALQIVADEARSPFAAESFDLAVSLLSLHTVDDVVGALVQARRMLRPDGLYLAAFFGGDTLKELRASLTEAEAEVSGGAGLRVLPFADPREAAGLLQRAGFALPVADVDRLEVAYAHPLKLMADLRAMGETSVLRERPHRPLTRAVLARAFQIYAERFGAEDGRVRATFEIITLTGWAPHESQQKPLKPGSAKARLADALGVVERRAGDA